MSDADISCLDFASQSVVSSKPKGRFFCNPTRRSTMRLQPLHPRPRFFVLFHPSKAHKAHHPTLKKGTFPIGIALCAHHH